MHADEHGDRLLEEGLAKYVYPGGSFSHAITNRSPSRYYSSQFSLSIWGIRFLRERSFLSTSGSFGPRAYGSGVGENDTS